MAFLCFLGFCFLNAIPSFAPTSAPSSTPTADVANQASGAAGSPPIAETDSSQNWTYDSSTDEMTGTVVRYACTKSTNELQFAFPYDGGTTAKLCFRKKGKTLDAFVQMSSGQFNCGIESCTLKFKFDDGPIQAFSGEESSTHETGFLFIEPEGRLFTAISRAKKVKLQAEFFQDGIQVLTFDTQGLDRQKL